ncbi:amidohydrolase family protein [Christiangramia forsetii]|uniref:Secreted amidohydrolase n=2 Tax=Christiangramia forsetii TaxID=411153 RepID=A0M4F2_CHRFK|nr:amidohydrolase family protein [Christiangramia forsetii]GGG23566.1 amidohydrolase [Christiangramia forsetii]CAL67497.1 secreted amidohydrolase [Christiangramia forsetii KT0803]
MIKNTVLSLILLLLLFSCQENKKAQPEFDLIISNANIVDIQNDKIQPKKFIAINNDTIQLIGNMENFKNYKATKSLDAENNYVMPGLWDMHVHFRGGDSLIAENKGFLSLFLAYGVTTVRDAGGDISTSVLDWRDQISETSLDGPRIFTSGPKLDGATPAWEGSIKIKNEADIEIALDSLENMNVDYVKMYDGSLTPGNFYGIIQKAEKRGLKTTGHMPLKADFTTAIEYGLDGIEHMYYTVKASSPLSDSLSETGMGYAMMEPLIDTYDTELAREVFSKMNSAKVSITPTLYIGKTLANILEVEHSQDSLLNYIGNGIQKTYQGRVESAKRAQSSGSKMREKMENLSVEMIVPMYENGVKILAGSDSGAFNSFVYPGESLHSELEELVNAGLTPAHALETSVVNGPEFFGLEAAYGSLKKGKVADIIILQKNPLENIKNTRSIKSVIRNNKIYTPGSLLKTIKNPN